MAVCPMQLISVVEGVYTYQCMDCRTFATSTRQSDHALQCGCSEPNPDCVVLIGGGGDPSMAAPAMPKTPAVAVGETMHTVHRVDASLIAKGATAKVPVDFTWPLPSAEIDPEFAGEKSFHVLRIGGSDRIIRVLKARIPSPNHLLHAFYQGKKKIVSPIPEFELNIGQETDLPPGLTPIKLTEVGKRKAGTFYVQAKRGGAKANPTVFHILLSRA